jgi:site-specific DNA-methyltransferase (adenine-specific)
MEVDIIQGDCTAIVLPEASIDAIVTDPPYHLTTAKRGGSGDASMNLRHPGGRRSRVTTGFMSKEWDGGDVAFRPETWAGALRAVSQTPAA